ncbi:MAG: ferredoxin--NADP reductase [Sphingobacteriaceae bacterium]|nr:ferredoxin--NADP reductase [Cytophagaceae bacterium]
MQEILTLCVRAIRPEAPEVATYFLESTDGQAVSYRAGQFLTLLFDFQGHEVRRSYSLSSAPGVDAELAITVKRIVNGEVSRYLFDHLHVGDTLRALPPSGRFVLDEETTGDLLLIAAGSGITPLFSILKSVLATQPSRPVILIYASRDDRNTIFLNEINALADRHPARLTVLYQRSAEGQRLNNQRLERLVLNHLRGPRAKQERLATRGYLCGPEEFMRMARITLLFMGFHADQIRREQFVIEAPPAPPVPTLSTPSRVTLLFREKTHILDVPAGEYLLTAALAAGIPLPYSCRGGRCSACAARCTAGRVAMRINDVLTARDLAEGWVLTCTGYAESEAVTLEV